MLIDAPGVEDAESKAESGDFILTDDNADEIMAMINRMNR